MQNSISRLKEILDADGSVDVKLRKGPRGRVKAEIHFVVKEEKKDITLPPIILQGTYEEFDHQFFQLLADSGDKVSGSYVDAEAFDKEVAKKAKAKGKAAPEKTLLDVPAETKPAVEKPVEKVVEKPKAETLPPPPVAMPDERPSIEDDEFDEPGMTVAGAAPTPTPEPEVLESKVEPTTFEDDDDDF